MKKIDFTKIRKLSWIFIRKYFLKYGLFFIGKRLAGPWGFIASKALPLFLDKIVRPIWLMTGRKISKYFRKKKGKKQAKEIRDAETNDDVFDSINRS